MAMYGFVGLRPEQGTEEGVMGDSSRASFAASYGFVSEFVDTVARLLESGRSVSQFPMIHKLSTLGRLAGPQALRLDLESTASLRNELQAIQSRLSTISVTAVESRDSTGVDVVAGHSDEKGRPRPVFQNQDEGWSLSLAAGELVFDDQDAKRQVRCHRLSWNGEHYVTENNELVRASWLGDQLNVVEVRAVQEYEWLIAGLLDLCDVAIQNRQEILFT